jgi:hypothetical protein
VVHGSSVGIDALVHRLRDWVDDDGAVQFRDDIYGHDARQERILPASPIPGSMQVAPQGARPEAYAAPASARQIADARGRDNGAPSPAWP